MRPALDTLHVYYVIALEKTSNTSLDKSGEDRNPCLSPTLVEMILAFPYSVWYRLWMTALGLIKIFLLYLIFKSFLLWCSFLLYFLVLTRWLCNLQSCYWLRYLFIDIYWTIFLTLNKSYLTMAYLLFHVFNQLIYVDNLCIYVHQGYWSIVFGGLCLWVCYQGNASLIEPVWKDISLVLGEFQIYNIWKHSAVNSVSLGAFLGKLLCFSFWCW